MIALNRIEAAKPLHVDFAPGESDTLVVSFSGVGQRRHGVPGPEFAKMTTTIARANVLFIADESRSWMNGPGIATEVVRVVEEIADKIAAGEIIALGNSMGGSAAMVLALLTRVDRVLAIAPQYSVHPELMPDETRWWFFRRQIADWPYPSVPDLRDSDSLVTVLHGGSEDEVMHAARFPTDAGYRHYIFPDRGHALARELHDAGLLRPIVQAIIAGQPTSARKAIEDAGGILRETFEANGSNAFSEGGLT